MKKLLALVIVLGILLTGCEYKGRERKRFRKLRKTCISCSQKTAIEHDAFLYKLYMQNATDYVKEHKIKSGTDVYLSKALYSTTFSAITEMNAFSFLQFLLPLITPIYTFKFEREKLKQADEDVVNEWLTKVNAKLTQELSDKEKEIILFVIKNKKISSTDCQKLLGISRVMANRYFNRLIEKKLLVKKGVGKSTYYMLVQIGVKAAQKKFKN